MYTKFRVVRENSLVKDIKTSIWEADGGFMIPVHSKPDQEVRIHFDW